MQLEEVRVISLFGRFDHVIPINLDDRLTIITAPNGFGKTVLLNLVKLFFKKRFLQIAKYDFATIEFRFSGKKGVIIRGKRDAGDGDTEKKPLRFEPVNMPKKAKPWDLDWFQDRPRGNYPPFERYLPFMDRIASDLWMDERSGETYSVFELVELYADDLPTKFVESIRLPEWLETFVNSVDCHLIETQRLLQIEVEESSRHYGGHRSSRSVVSRNAKDLSKRIGEILQSYANDSQQLDQSFPKRVIAELAKEEPAEGEIRKRLTLLEERRSQLVDAGLLDRTASAPITAADEIEARTGAQNQECGQHPTPMKYIELFVISS